MVTYYSILEVPQTATHDEIRKAYLKLASKYHPDKYINEEEKMKAHNLFVKIGEAYETLSNEEKRKQYDKNLKKSSSNYDIKSEKNHNENNYENIFKYFDKMFKKHLKMFNSDFGTFDILHDFEHLHKKFLRNADIENDTFHGFSKLQETVIINGKPKTIIKEMTNKNGLITEKIIKIDENGKKTQNVTNRTNNIKNSPNANIKRIQDKKN